MIQVQLMSLFGMIIRGGDMNLHSVGHQTLNYKPGIDFPLSVQKNITKEIVSGIVKYTAMQR